MLVAAGSGFVIPMPDSGVMTTTLESTDRLSDVTNERLEADLCQLAADLAAGTARWLLMVAEYDRRGTWAQWECRSMADWLVWQCGVSLITARQYVHVARLLTVYSLLRAEFEAGRLSYSRVRALCRCVTPENEADMVAMGRYASAPQLEKFAAAVERAKKRGEPGSEERQHEQRSLQLFLDDDGTWIIRGRLPAEVGTVLRRALDDELRRQDTTDTTVGMPPARLKTPVEQRRVDALTAIIHAGHLTLTTGGLTDEQTEQARPLIIVHRFADGDELETGPAIPTTLADRLACDADTYTMTHTTPTTTNDDRECGCSEVTIGCSRRRRMPTKAVRRALQDRDQCCRFPGCTRRRNLTPHHVKEHANGGPTTASNLVMLCAEHHGLIHRKHWTITGNPNGELHFLPPNRQPIPTTTADLERIIDTLTGPIAPQGWGDRFDLDHAILITLHNQHLADQRRAQETATQETAAQQQAGNDAAASSSPSPTTAATEQPE